MGDNSGATSTAADDLLLKQFFAEVSEVERENEVSRFFYFFFLRIFRFWFMVEKKYFNCYQLGLSFVLWFMNFLKYMKLG